MPPRPYQSEALSALRAARGRGVVVLPSAGKTQVAVMAIDHSVMGRCEELRRAGGGRGLGRW
jgi:hypothetical protein